jgi:hypothetical protein
MLLSCIADVWCEVMIAYACFDVIGHNAEDSSSTASDDDGGNW